MPNTPISILGIGPVFSVCTIAKVRNINHFDGKLLLQIMLDSLGISISRKLLKRKAGVNRYAHKRTLALTARKLARSVFRIPKRIACIYYRKKSFLRNFAANALKLEKLFEFRGECITAGL